VSRPFLERVLPRPAPRALLRSKRSIAPNAATGKFLDDRKRQATIAALANGESKRAIAAIFTFRLTKIPLGCYFVGKSQFGGSA